MLKTAVSLAKLPVDLILTIVKLILDYFTKDKK
ncbi:hypothetical protein [Microviridae sp.]|nr:hypothetical protein [Microviridae sp.]